MFVARVRDRRCMELQDCTRCSGAARSPCSGAAGADPTASACHATGTEGIELAEVADDMLAAESTRRRPPRIEPDDDEDDDDDEEEVIGMPMGCVCAPSGVVRVAAAETAGVGTLAPGAPGLAGTEEGKTWPLNTNWWDSPLPREAGISWIQPRCASPQDFITK